MKNLTFLTISLFLLFFLSFSVDAANDKLPRGWLKIKVDTGSFTLPFSIANNLNISLKTTLNNNYSVEYKSGDAMTNALASGEVFFKDVPVDEPIQLIISYTSPSGITETYSSTYKFRYPSSNTSTALSTAGNMGEFKIQIEPPKITCVK